MYQAKVEIRQELQAGSFTIIDTSTGDETPISRIVTLRDGKGKTYTYEFNFTNEILVEGLLQDLAFNIDYIATVATPVFGSLYSYRTAFLITGYAEDYLLSLQGKIHCNPNIDKCNTREIEQFLSRSSEVIYIMESAKFFVDRCNIFKAQQLLDYIDDYITKKTYNNCNCGCSH